MIDSVIVGGFVTTVGKSSLVNTLRDGVVNFLADKAKDIAGDEVKSRIESLHSDAKLNKQIQGALERAAGRWAEDSPERRAPIRDAPDAWVCLAVYEDLKEGYECVVYPLRKIKQLIFEAPRLNKLIGKRQVVYLETLQKHGVFK